MAETDRDVMRKALQQIVNRHRPTWQKRCEECNLTVPTVGCPSYFIAREALADRSVPPLMRGRGSLPPVTTPAPAAADESGAGA